MERSILHLDMDTFFVSVEQRNNPGFRGKPLIVGGTSDRGVVPSCSYETRKFGVRSGMAMRIAKQLCPEAIIVKGDYQAYDQGSDMVKEIIEESVPLYEKTSIDEFNCDLTGMDRYVGCWHWSRELKQKITKEIGLPVTIALSENKSVSKIAANEAKPKGQIQIDVKQIKPFLDPLGVRKIPMVGQVTAHTLRSMGVARVVTLRMIPPILMERTFRKPGRTMRERANGIDPSPVVPFSRRKSLSKEVTFQTATTDIAFLRNTLMKMVEQLCNKLRMQNRCTWQVSVKIKYSEFNTYLSQTGLAPTSSDHTILNCLLLIFEKLYERQLLVRLIGMTFGKLVRGKEQLGIFDDSGKISLLYDAMDKIKLKYGDNAVGRASCYQLKETNEP